MTEKIAIVEKITFDGKPLTNEEKSQIIAFIVDKFFRDEVKGVMINIDVIHIQLKD